MKVAIFEPFPRVCGVTTWAFELVEGFRALGHEADVVSCTKSGRARATTTADGRPRVGWQWWGTAPDRTVKWADAPAMLDEYDLIVLNEPKNNPLDLPAQKLRKAGEATAVPEYVEALARTRTPWVTAFHDRTAYAAHKAPFLAETLAAGNFTGLAVECRPGAYAVAAYAAAGHVTKLLSWPWLPYTSRRSTAGWLPLTERPAVVGMTGRTNSTKGTTSLLAVADQVTPPWEVRFHGADAGGLAPTTSYNWYEPLVEHHGWRGLRGDPNDPRERTERSISLGNYAPMTASTPYGMRHPETGAVFRYMGGYGDRVGIYNDLRVMVMLSRRELATTLEYTALEALDAGCVMIAPKYVIEDMRGATYDIVWVDYERGVKQSKDTGYIWHVPAEREALIDGLHRAIAATENWDPAENYRSLERYHAPQHLAGAIVQAL